MDFIVAAAIAGSVIAGAIAIGPSIKIGVEMAPYLYANTRCSARVGLLLKRKDYEQLMSASSTEEMFSLLDDTSYSSIVEHAKDAAAFSSALDENLSETYSWLVSIMPKRLQKIMSALGKKFEINDIKNALNSCAAGLSPSKLDNIEDESLRIRLESCKAVDSFIAALKDTEYESVVSGNIQSVDVITNLLDVYYYSLVGGEIRSLKDDDGVYAFRDYWRKVVDMVNVRLTLRKIGGISELALIEGGHLSIKDLQAATDMMQLESILSKSIFKDFISGNSAFEMEQGMFAAFLKEASAVNAKHSLKTGSLVKFIVQKELEVRNLNIITKLKSENFKPDEIEKLIII